MHGVAEGLCTASGTAKAVDIDGAFWNSLQQGPVSKLNELWSLLLFNGEPCLRRMIHREC